ncbi:MAG TPA: hypothetical protein VFO01_06890 [Trebonia sp.]|nr:hypothetical protein [Trebonia sp.]
MDAGRRTPGVALTRFRYADHGGIVRGKAAATWRLAENGARTPGVV